MGRETVPGRVSSLSEEVEAQKVTGSVGKPGLSGVAEQSEWELALGLQAAGALEFGKQGTDHSEPSRTGPGSQWRGHTGSRVRTQPGNEFPDQA